jgi:hypothetical protein
VGKGKNDKGRRRSCKGIYVKVSYDYDKISFSGWKPETSFEAYLSWEELVDIKWVPIKIKRDMYRYNNGNKSAVLSVDLKAAIESTVVTSAYTGFAVIKNLDFVNGTSENYSSHSADRRYREAEALW